jgi:hypothetical protein
MPGLLTLADSFQERATPTMRGGDTLFANGRRDTFSGKRPFHDGRKKWVSDQSAL